MDIEQVWKAYKDKLYYFLLSRVKSSEDAEDLLQDILIKTHQSLHTIKSPDKFQSWLFTVARNALTDHYRSRGPLMGELPDNLADDVEQDDEVIQALSACVRPFLEQLPEDYKNALEAVYLQGKSQKALSEEYGLSHSAIKSRVQRGRKQLEALFQACCKYELDARGNIVDFSRADECC